MELDGREIPAAAFGGRKVRALLRVLAVRRPDLLPHDVLAQALWPERLPADPAGNLNVLVNRARRAAGDAVVVTGAGGYALGPCLVDADEFLSAVAGARRSAGAGDLHGALRTAFAALDLWADPLSEDLYADWAQEPRDRLLAARIDALEIASGAALGLGQGAVATEYAAEAVASDPLRESLVLLLARSLAARGDPAAALARITDLRRRLADELGVDLSAEAQELQLRLLRGEPLPAPAPSVAGLVPRRRSARAVPVTEDRFVGREREIATLRRVVAQGGVAAVAGAPGAGKSRLVTEALRGVDLPVVAARAFRPEKAEAWGLARTVLREALALDPSAEEAAPARAREALGSILPEIAPVSSAPLDGESRRSLVLAGGLRILEAATGDGAVLVVDDLQWADPSSVLLLLSALARVRRLGAVVLFRTDELPDGVLDPLRDVRPVTDVLLGPLPLAAVETLVGDAALARVLVTATDGTPFAVSEVIRELAARGALDRSAPAAVGPDVVDLAAELGREGQRRAVRRRAARHGGEDDVLALVALLAREVPARTVATAAGIPERAVLARLSDLAAADLLRLGEQGWTTAHDLVGETVVAELSPPERGRLHALLARALEAEDADGAEIARHHHEAGDGRAAAGWYALAARQALDGQATREVADLASAGLALDPTPLTRTELLDLRAQARAAHGDLSGATGDLRVALQEPSGSRRPFLLARLAMLTFGAQDPRRASELAELAIVAAGEDEAARAFALETGAILDMNLGEPARAGQRSEQALRLYRHLGDAGGAARLIDGRAMATFLDGRISDAVDEFDRAASLFQDAGELLRVITPRSTRGHGLVFLARPAEGLAESSAALRLARELDAPEGRSYALWHRSEALSALGRHAEAEADAREALDVAIRCGHRGWTATAYRALGIALQTRGALDEAVRAFEASAATAGDDLALFAAWAAARAATVAVAQGRLSDADELVRSALATGPPLARYEARLAAVELALARDDPAAPALAGQAEAEARAGGHLVSAERLTALATTRRQ